MTQLHTNDFTLYRQHIKDRGHTASGFLCTGLRNSSSNLLCTQTNGYRSRAESESVSNHSDKLLYQPIEQKVFDPAQTTSSSSFSFPIQAANLHRRLWLSFIRSMFLNASFTKRVSPNDITPPANFLLGAESLDHVRFVLPEETGHFPKQVAH